MTGALKLVSSAVYCRPSSLSSIMSNTLGLSIAGISATYLGGATENAEGGTAAAAAANGKGQEVAGFCTL